MAGTWLYYANEDLYNSFNICWGEKGDMNTWIECFEVARETSAKYLVNQLNAQKAGPAQAVNLPLKAAWQEEALKKRQAEQTAKQMAASPVATPATTYAMPAPAAGLAVVNAVATPKGPVAYPEWMKSSSATTATYHGDGDFGIEFGHEDFGAEFGEDARFFVGSDAQFGVEEIFGEADKC